MFDHLRKLDTSALFKLNPKQTTVAMDAQNKSADVILRTGYAKHLIRHATATRSAIKTIAPLPQPNEVVTIIAAGNIEGWDYVSAIIALAGCEVDELYIATYGIGKYVINQIGSMLDDGTIKRVWFTTSTFMRAAKGDRFAELTRVLGDRKQYVTATRNHAKLAALKFTDGRKYVFDGSINLSKCNNVEIGHLWRSDELFDAYARYVKSQTEGLSEGTEAKTTSKRKRS